MLISRGNIGFIAETMPANVLVSNRNKIQMIKGVMGMVILYSTEL